LLHSKQIHLDPLSIHHQIFNVVAAHAFEGLSKLDQCPFHEEIEVPFSLAREQPCCGPGKRRLVESAVNAFFEHFACAR
jgi:hypothetical protein